MPLDENLPSTWICFDLLCTGKRKQGAGEPIRALRFYLQHQHFKLPQVTVVSWEKQYSPMSSFKLVSLACDRGGKARESKPWCYNTLRQSEEVLLCWTLTCLLGRAWHSEFTSLPGIPNPSQQHERPPCYKHRHQCLEPARGFVL